MSNRLYVGNLSFSTSRESLESAFAAAGEVREISMPTDRETGQPRGFAFVEMSSPTEVQKAIGMFNGYSLDERQLAVSVARPREERSGGGSGGGFRSQNNNRNNNSNKRRY